MRKSKKELFIDWVKIQGTIFIVCFLIAGLVYLIKPDLLEFPVFFGKRITRFGLVANSFQAIACILFAIGFLGALIVRPTHLEGTDRRTNIQDNTLTTYVQIFPMGILIFLVGFFVVPWIAVSNWFNHDYLFEDGKEISGKPVLVQKLFQNGYLSMPANQFVVNFSNPSTKDVVILARPKSAIPLIIEVFTDDGAMITSSATGNSYETATSTLLFIETTKIDDYYFNISETTSADILVDVFVFYVEPFDSVARGTGMLYENHSSISFPIEAGQYQMLPIIVNPEDGLDVDFEVVDGDGKVVLRGENAGINQSEVSIFSPPESGKYTLRVFQDDEALRGFFRYFMVEAIPLY
jgi:hypothetical protein